MAKKIKIVVLGSLLYDCVTYGPRLPRMGETIIGNKNGFFFGGKGANQAVQAARMGAEVYFIGRVGEDETGEKLIWNLDKNGINTDHVIKDKKVPTGTCCIHVDDRGDNAIMIAPLANLEISTQDIDKTISLMDNCDIFLTQLEVNIEATVYAIKKAHKAGLPIVLNPAPAIEIPEEIFPLIDFITPNETETEFFTGIMPAADNLDSCRKAADALLEKGVKNVLITLGKKGVYFKNSREEQLIPTFEDIKAVDTTAAGDAFNAAFTVTLAEGTAVPRALMYGNAAGSAAASQAGSQPSLAMRETIEKIMTSQA
ncbi:MAG: ribokinase [Spirochaetales bacterium]|nr:ribokinase [Spirochaetales bacterium]